MKKRILSIGVIGIATFLFGCSDDAPSPIAPSDTAYNDSSSSTVTQAGYIYLLKKGVLDWNSVKD